MQSAVAVGLWNVRWAKRRSASGVFFAARLAAMASDVLCVTEGHADILPEGGFAITSDADYGYSLTPGRRKVLLWSRAPWDEIDTVGAADLPPGRFVAGQTETPLGIIRFVGVCIPWQEAHVRTGLRNRRPWEDHLTFLKHLAVVLNTDTAGATILLGDFNQTLPRSRQPTVAAASLRTALGDRYHVVTSGAIPGAPRLAIDHLAVSSALAMHRVRYVSPANASGKAMSDHFGLHITLRDARDA